MMPNTLRAHNCRPFLNRSGLRGNSIVPLPKKSWCGSNKRIGKMSNFVMHAIEDVPYCIPADGVFCRNCRWANGTCYDAECEGFHISKENRVEQRKWELPSKPKLIIAAGPERSGSTWLFNAVRLLFQHAGVPLMSFWINHITDSKLDGRHVGKPGHPHVLVKTHHWSNEWDISKADYIMVTHRDLRGVVASYRRVGWAHNIPKSYVNEHFQWKAVSCMDFAFENIVNDGVGQMRALAEELGLVDMVDVVELDAQVRSLRPPVNAYGPDPVTKLWPSHLSPSVMEQLDASDQSVSKTSMGSMLDDASVEKDLFERFPGYMKGYGYVH